MNRMLQVLAAFIPLLLTPLLGYAIAEGLIDLGSGEKDLLWVFVYAIWAMIYTLAALILIYRQWPMQRWLWRSAQVAALSLFLLWLLLFVFSVLRHS